MKLGERFPVKPVMFEAQIIHCRKIPGRHGRHGPLQNAAEFLSFTRL